MLCPICKKTVDDADIDKPARTYPFCSERCKLVDLGRWLSGKYRIPASPADQEHSPDAPPSPAPPARGARKG